MNTAAMMADGTARKNEAVLPPSPENTSASGSDEDTTDGAPEPITPPSSQKKSMRKAPAAKTTRKPASTVPAKRKNDECIGGQEKATKRKITKKATELETPQPTVTVKAASAMDSVYVPPYNSSSLYH